MKLSEIVRQESQGQEMKIYYGLTVSRPVAHAKIISVPVRWWHRYLYELVQIGYLFVIALWLTVIVVVNS